MVPGPCRGGVPGNQVVGTVVLGGGGSHVLSATGSSGMDKLLVVA